MTEKLHILLKHARSYEVRPAALAPEGCYYDYEVGAWLVEDTNQLFVDTPARSRPQTKKEDIETGEDQKGE
jgi:hypothetical protein